MFSEGGAVTRRCVAVLAPYVTMHGHATARDRATRQSGMALNTYEAAGSDETAGLNGAASPRF
jgi:hypothetical protein